MCKKIKTCSVCLQEKSLEDFHKKHDGILGRNSRCKSCIKNKKETHFILEKRKSDFKKLLDQYLLECIHCKEIKNLEDFVKKDNKIGRTRICKICNAKIRRERRKEKKKSQPLKQKTEKDVLFEQNKASCIKCDNIKFLDKMVKNKNNKKYGIYFICKDCKNEETFFKNNSILIGKVNWKPMKNIIIPKGFQRCNKCRQIKKIDDFLIDNKGRMKTCKFCINPSHRERLELQYKGLKRCTVCKEIKFFSNFYKRGNNYSSSCKDCQKIKAKDYKYKNRDMKLEKRRKYNKERYAKDIDYKLKHSISSAVKNELKGMKNCSSMDYVPFTIQDLKTHLESLWLENMTWDNYGNGYGKWNIDHIICQNLYLYKNKETGKEYLEDIKRSWNLRNLRPLWSIENTFKKDKIFYSLYFLYKICDLLPERFNKLLPLLENN